MNSSTDPGCVRKPSEWCCVSEDGRKLLRRVREVYVNLCFSILGVFVFGPSPAKAASLYKG